MSMIRALSAASAAALLALASMGGAAPPEGPKLDVTVTGLHSAKGQLVACLWREKPGFPSCEKSSTALRRVVPVSGETMHLSLPLPGSGRYAVTVIHDEDSNGKMKHNFIGMPAEGVGISNNPGGMPGFDKSLVDLSPGGTLTIKMRYLFG
ncbi:MAG: DUF2141 domain-containing protein [Novosphingobium sp.]|nr:DUF2141 domain-containing protein [Novosphingobium sp.]